MTMPHMEKRSAKPEFFNKPRQGATEHDHPKGPSHEACMSPHKPKMGSHDQYGDMIHPHGFKGSRMDKAFMGHHKHYK